MFTLFITPAVYTFVARDRRSMVARRKRVAAIPGAERKPKAELPEAAE
jgi:hypothetical protein